MTRDQEVEGYTVPGGSLAIVNLWQFMNDPEHWDRPHLFRSVTGHPLYCNTKKEMFHLSEQLLIHFGELNRVSKKYGIFSICVDITTLGSLQLSQLFIGINSYTIKNWSFI